MKRNFYVILCVPKNFYKSASFACLGFESVKLLNTKNDGKHKCNTRKIQTAKPCFVA